jgi:hypothetical protein
VYATFLKFGMKEEAEEFQVAAKEKGKEAEGQMAHQSFSVEIPNEEIEVFLEEITAGDLESTLHRLAVNFCPRIDDLRKHLARVKQKAKMLSMVSQSKMGEQQVIARADPIDSDPEGRLMFQMAEHLQWMTGLLTASIDRIRSKYEFSQETMREFLSESLLFKESRIPLFEHAIKPFLQTTTSLQSTSWFRKLSIRFERFWPLSTSPRTSIVALTLRSWLSRPSTIFSKKSR